MDDDRLPFLPPEIQRPHGSLMFLTKFSPPQPAGLKCVDQLLHFCTAPSLLNPPNCFFFSHPSTSAQLIPGNRCVRLTHTNMAGWDGAGISFQDALNVQIVNNTVAHNDTLATSGVPTKSLGAPMASAPPGNCTMTGPTGASTASCPQSAGMITMPNSTLMNQTFTGPPVLTITFPFGLSCQSISDPLLANSIIWQNRSFHAGVTGPGTGTQNQQNPVGLFDAISNTAARTQASTGACATTPDTLRYWDLGVRGDTAPGTHGVSGLQLHPTYSVMTSTTGYDATNSSGAPPVVSQCCNGSRVSPECTVADRCRGPKRFGVPLGISNAVTPNPVFSFTPSATGDEGNNWINVNWGRLSLANDAVTGGRMETMAAATHSATAR